MSRRKKNSEFQFGFGHFVRLIIFGLLCYSAINYLSKNKTTIDPSTILGVTSSTQLPPNIKTAIDQIISHIPPAQKEQLNQILSNSGQFSGKIPQFIEQKIIEFKKDIITQIYQNILKSIEKK